MIPYLEYPVLEIGSYRLGIFPLFVGAAVVLQFQIVMRRAPRFGISREVSSSLLGWAIGLGLLSAHVFDVIAYTPEKLRENPLELLRLWGGLSSFGGMVGGLAGIAWVMWRKGLSGVDMLRFSDCLVFALPFTLLVGRAGCALQHDHPGVLSEHWLAVAFPEGSRFDLGLLEFLYLPFVCGVFLSMDRRPRPDGFYIGLFFALYGPVRFVLDALRVADARYLGWTPAQYLSVLATFVGLALVVMVLRRESGPAARQPAG